MFVLLVTLQPHTWVSKLWATFVSLWTLLVLYVHSHMHYNIALFCLTVYFLHRQSSTYYRRFLSLMLRTVSILISKTLCACKFHSLGIWKEYPMAVTGYAYLFGTVFDALFCSYYLFSGQTQAFLLPKHVRIIAHTLVAWYFLEIY